MFLASFVFLRTCALNGNLDEILLQIGFDVAISKVLHFESINELDEMVAFAFEMAIWVKARLQDRKPEGGGWGPDRQDA